MPPKQIGVRGLPIRSQGREIISNVTDFMKKEAEEGITIPLKNHRKRILAATKISRATYQTICKEALKVEWGAKTSFSSPSKKKPRKAPKLDCITTDQVKSIREIIYNFYIIEKRKPTVKCILQKIKDTQILDNDLSQTSLRVFLKKLGFRFQPTKNIRTAIMETNDIRLARINYLKKIQDYRNEKRNIIYTDETFIFSSQTKDIGWYDETSKELHKSISKEPRLIIVHAGGEKGFINNGLLIFRSGTKTGAYHNEMNHENFMKWVTNQLLPNLPENSVVVVDNALYHNVPLEKQITTESLKSELVEWLQEKNIPADPELTKPELYKIIKENQFRFPIRYKLDELLRQHGHCVLRLPPNHPELNPIEKVWTIVKNWVASQNTTFKLNDVEELTRQKFLEIKPQEWYNVCDNVKKHEIQLLEREYLFDTTLESLMLTANTESSEDSDSESECVIKCEYFSDSDN